MKPFRSLTLVLLALVAAPAAADPVVVTFDTLTGDNRQVPDGYGGINWLDNWTHYAFTQPPYNARSRPQRVYPTYGPGRPVGATRETRFTFVSPDQYFSGAWFAGHSTLQSPPLPAAAYVRFYLYDDGAPVAISDLLIPTAEPAFLSSGYKGPVDAVGVWSNNVGYWIMDDVTYGGDVPVPEPATLLLIAGGLVGAGAARKRRAG